MNRVLYQLSYAAIGPASFGCAEISFVIISLSLQFVKTFIRIFTKNNVNNYPGVIIVKRIKYLLLFSAGGLGYMGLELLWRGWSHRTMFFAGGTCFLLLGRLRNQPPWLQAAAGAGVITAVELAAGLLLNRQYGIWDYRNVPLNFMGQICLPYSLLWMPVGLGGATLYRLMDKKMMHT